MALLAQLGSVETLWLAEHDSAVVGLSLGDVPAVRPVSSWSASTGVDLCPWTPKTPGSMRNLPTR